MQLNMTLEKDATHLLQAAVFAVSPGLRPLQTPASSLNRLEHVGVDHAELGEALTFPVN